MGIQCGSLHKRRAYFKKRYKLNRLLPLCKVCSTCKKRLNCAEFYKYSSYKDGLRPSCKNCFVKNQCKYQKDNIKDRLRYSNKYTSKRLKSDISFKLRTRIRQRLRIAIKCNYNKGSTIELLGCSIKHLKEYIESKFKPGMSWDNWSLKGWHIDHIKPLSSFDLNSPQQLKEACHYTNLQPLWALDNLTKGSKVIYRVASR